MTVEKAIILLKEGDEKGFEFLWSLYSKALWRHILRLGVTCEEAKDILQDVSIKMITKSCHFKIKQNPDKEFKAWLFRISSTTTADFYRKKKKTLNNDLKAQNFEEKENCRADDLIDLKIVLSGLSLRHKNLLALVSEGFSYLEISRISAMSLSSVKVELFRARSILKEKMSGGGL